MENKLNLKEYPFPSLTAVDLSFPVVDIDIVLLKEAQTRGFDDHNNAYYKLFMSLFFNGGSVKFKNGLNDDFKTRCWMYMKCLAGSFAPKHEHKSAVCAMLLSELCELEQVK